MTRILHSNEVLTPKQAAALAILRTCLTRLKQAYDRREFTRIAISALKYVDPETQIQVLIGPRHHSPFQLEHGIDVWVDNKVFNVEYSADQRFQIVSFRRGPWEEAVLSWANRPTKLRTVS